MMDTDRLQLGINDELRRAMGGFDGAASALLADYARLLCKCGEPLPVLLRHYAPTGYEQSQRSEADRLLELISDAIDDLSNPNWQHGGYAMGIPDGVSLKWVEGVIQRLRAGAPTGYEQSGSFEIIRESCPRYGVDDGPDAMEDV